MYSIDRKKMPMDASWMKVKKVAPVVSQSSIV